MLGIDLNAVQVLKSSDESLVLGWSMAGVLGFSLLFIGIGLCFLVVDRLLMRLPHAIPSRKLLVLGILSIFIFSPLAGVGTWFERLEITKEKIVVKGLWSQPTVFSIAPAIELSFICKERSDKVASKYWELTYLDGSTYLFWVKDLMWSAARSGEVGKFLRTKGVKVADNCKRPSNPG